MPPPRGPLFDGLPCVVCRQPLSHLDAYRCGTKLIRVVYRGPGRYGVCTACLEQGLKIERRLHGKLIDKEELEKQAGKPLKHVVIRCYFCGSVLNHNEKNRHRMHQEKFLQTRKSFKGRCYECYSDGRGSEDF
ncbi:E6 [Camelus dromedarius papillomavirus 2]|uniref:Protein E6 n=1 Tax=Camelus dromedarius papillomavirus 2 TaxID=996651 RepID=F2YGH5_9PAPI|nr:E6 [Camelus dromedarius papillomavirus 2]ADZ53060.1 E6 [Camelus dromedarius papillomavirus 2]